MSALYRLQIGNITKYSKKENAEFVIDGHH